MKVFAALFLTLILDVLCAVAGNQPPPPTAGSHAPDFSLPNQEGTQVSLNQFKGNWVVLYFYPKDFSSGCTVEAHNFQRDIGKYTEKNAVIVGVNLRDHFGIDEDFSWEPRWNIAPTQHVPIIRQNTGKGRSFKLVRWGLIPSWAKNASIATGTINAISETAAEKPAFRDSLQSRKCLVPADGFYEWQPVGSKQKQPFSIGILDDSVFAFAGLWDSWRDSSNQLVETYTILTTRPNALVADVHNRMPVILHPEAYALWLDPKIKDPSLVAPLLHPFDAIRMKKYPVSTRVNRPENDDQSCAQEGSISVAQPALF